MESDNLPNEFDVIVLGTGMCESIVAAGLSRVGLQVLHIDRYENYGGDWASYNFTSLQAWIADHKSKEEKPSEQYKPEQGDLNDGERLILLPTESDMISHIYEEIHAIEGDGEVESIRSTILKQLSTDETPLSSVISTELPVSEEEVVPELRCSRTEEATPVLNIHGEVSPLKTEACHSPPKCSDVECAIESEMKPVLRQWTMSDIKQQWRKFSIDIMPKLLYCRGPLVELLISSDVAKYCEFRSVNQVLTVVNKKLEVVPCSRSDVFASHNVGVIEKRMLMKLLTFCVDFDKMPCEYAGFEDKLFTEFLMSKSLTDTVRHYVQRAIAMVPDTANTLEGLIATQRFLRSLGRYGNTAFLWPIYGSGELPQCFARMCAVFGGIYCLRRQAVAAIINRQNNKLTAVVTSNGQRISSKWLVMEASYASSELTPNFKITSRISRAILLTNRSLKPSKQEQITLLSLPLPSDNNTIVTIYELSSISMACPDNLYIVHLTCRSSAATAKEDLWPIVENLFFFADDEGANDSKPHVLWSLYFNVNNTSRCDLTTNVDNIIVIGGPDECIDYDNALLEAKKSFEIICPGKEFLPKAPNPEDIIYDGGEQDESAKSGFEVTENQVSADDVCSLVNKDMAQAGDDVNCALSDAGVGKSKEH